MYNMKTSIFKITVLPSMLCALLLVVFSCGKQKQENDELCWECDELCLYASVEDFHKTAPFINAYLIHLSKNAWRSDEQKLQALVKWLNVQPCIIRAELQPVIKSEVSISPKSTPAQPPRGIIAIWFDENLTEEAIFLEIGPRHPYDSEIWVANRYRYMKPGEVRVQILHASSINMVFDFINTFDFEVLWVYDLWFYSTAHNRNYVLDNKSNLYIAGVGITPGSPYFSPTFYSIDNKYFQDDWLKFMEEYQLIESTDRFSPEITFLVPDGKEREWAAKFLANFDFVTSTNVNWWFQGM